MHTTPNFIEAANGKISIDDAINSGVNYLHQHQYPNGEFCAYISGDDAMLEWCMPDSTIFPSALISHSLLFLKQLPQAEEMLAKATLFLQYQMGRGGTWNHFTNSHALRSLCPSDVDDTCCVSAFLQQRTIGLPKNFNYELIKHNRNRHGLFYTWFAFRFRLNYNKVYWRLACKEFLHPLKTFLFWRKMECGRYDVDAVVNANVLYYLGENEITSPIITWLLQIIGKEQESDCDKWYRNPFSVYYFISRNFYLGIAKLQPVAKPITERILFKVKANGCLGDNVLDTALAVCTLLNLNYYGAELENAIKFIIKMQGKNGGWQRWRMYYGGPKKITGYGSEELTTAFCLEALARFHLSKKYEQVFR